MVNRSLLAAGALGGAVLWSAAALASPGNALGNVNMRTGPGTQYSVITTIPAGAPVEVFECQSWCQVGYAGTHGYVSANYVGGGYTAPAPRAYYQPAPVYTPAPSVGIYYDHPWYNAPRHRYWRDEHRRHFRRGDGAYFEFGF